MDIFGAKTEVVLCKTCTARNLKAQRDELQRISRMTREETDLRFDDVSVVGRPDTAKMMQAIGRFVENPVGMLTIHGSNGNGKSAALIVAVNECLDRGIPAVYIPAYDMLNWIQDAFNKDKSVRDGSALDRLERLKNVLVLAIDELQAVKMTDWRTEQLENLVDWRYRYGLDGKLGTLIGMNEPPSKTTPRIFSRITDGRNADNPVIQNNDPDIRGVLR